MRLIDADAVISTAYDEMFDFEANQFEGFITSFPIIDAVPVVRCLECIHRTENGNCGHPRHEDTLPTAYSNDFCSYGERKDGDG